MKAARIWTALCLACSTPAGAIAQRHFPADSVIRADVRRVVD